MELNYIASFSPHLELVAAVKIVSDNLSVDDYVNNAIRESGVLTSDEVWANVRQAVETILSRNQDKKVNLFHTRTSFFRPAPYVNSLMIWWI